MVELRVCCESGGFGLVLLIIVCVVFIHYFQRFTQKKRLIQEQEQNECTRRTYGSSVLRSCSKFRSTQCKFS